MKFDKKTTAKIEKILAVFSDFLETNDHMGVAGSKKPVSISLLLTIRMMSYQPMKP